MRKKVLVIGATGTIGKAVVAELEHDCDVIKVGRSSGDYQVDITSTDSIIQLYQQFNDANAVVCRTISWLLSRLPTHTRRNGCTGLSKKHDGSANWPSYKSWLALKDLPKIGKIYDD